MPPSRSPRRSSCPRARGSLRRGATPPPPPPRFEPRAGGRGSRQLDAAALEQLILGKPFDEALTILRPYGDPAIALTPDWFGTIPQLDWRVPGDGGPPAGGGADRAAPRPPRRAARRAPDPPPRRRAHRAAAPGPLRRAAEHRP